MSVSNAASIASSGTNRQHDKAFPTEQKQHLELALREKLGTALERRLTCGK